MEALMFDPTAANRAKISSGGVHHSLEHSLKNRLRPLNHTNRPFIVPRKISRIDPTFPLAKIKERRTTASEAYYFLLFF